MEGLLECVDLLARDVSLCHAGDVAESSASIIRHECVHRHLVLRDAQSVSNTLWEVCKDLVGGVLRADYEWVVQAKVEAELH